MAITGQIGRRDVDVRHSSIEVICESRYRFGKEMSIIQGEADVDEDVICRRLVKSSLQFMYHQMTQWNLLKNMPVLGAI